MGLEETWWPLLLSGRSWVRLPSGLPLMLYLSGIFRFFYFLVFCEFWFFFQKLLRIFLKNCIFHKVLKSYEISRTFSLKTPQKRPPANKLLIESKHTWRYFTNFDSLRRTFRTFWLRPSPYWVCLWVVKAILDLVLFFLRQYQHRFFYEIL